MDSRLVPLENAPRRRQITVRRYASAADADRHDLEFWTQLPVSERIVIALDTGHPDKA